MSISTCKMTKTSRSEWHEHIYIHRDPTATNPILSYKAIKIEPLPMPTKKGKNRKDIKHRNEDDGDWWREKSSYHLHRKTLEVKWIDNHQQIEF